jgi:hypothetical protein
MLDCQDFEFDMISFILELPPHASMLHCHAVVLRGTKMILMLKLDVWPLPMHGTSKIHLDHGQWLVNS